MRKNLKVRMSGRKTVKIIGGLTIIMSSTAVWLMYASGFQKPLVSAEVMAVIIGCAGVSAALVLTGRMLE